MNYVQKEFPRKYYFDIYTRKQLNLGLSKFEPATEVN